MSLDVVFYSALLRLSLSFLILLLEPEHKIITILLVYLLSIFDSLLELLQQLVLLTVPDLPLFVLKLLHLSLMHLVLHFKLLILFATVSH